MSWTYSGDPSSSDVDEVRFLIQDIDTDDQLLSDEEIQYVIDKWEPAMGSNTWAAAACAENIAARFAREISVSGDGVSVAAEQLQDKYEQLAVSLRDAFKLRHGVAGTQAFAGGTLFDDYFDATIKPLSFAKGMHDSIRAGQQNYGGQAPQLPEYPEYAR